MNCIQDLTLRFAGPEFTGTANGELENKDDEDTVSNIT
jgi:hypothetical protein